MWIHKLKKKKSKRNNQCTYSINFAVRGLSNYHGNWNGLLRGWESQRAAGNLYKILNQWVLISKGRKLKATMGSRRGVTESVKGGGRVAVRWAKNRERK